MQEICDLKPADLERLVKRLVHHAWCKMQHRTYRGASLARGGHFEPGDFVDVAFARVLSGKRKWNKKEYPTVEDFLRSVVDSVISHVIRSAKHRRERHLLLEDAGDGEPAEYVVNDKEPDPANAVVNAEWAERQQKFYDAAIEQLDGDQFLIDMLSCMNAGITEPSEISILLGMAVDEVNNGKKRLRLRLEKIDTRVAPAKKGKPR